jgi:hypothetical protein
MHQPNSNPIKDMRLSPTEKHSAKHRKGAVQIKFMAGNCGSAYIFREAVPRHGVGIETGTR